jgi:hypothetical protein
MLIFQTSDAEIKSFNELKNNKEKYAVISTITSDDMFNRFRDEDNIFPFVNFGTITTVKKNKFLEDTTYTWNEVSMDNYDVLSKLVFSKSFKIKAKIKKISNFNPKISLI